jgi:hypothetical protein
MEVSAVKSRTVVREPVFRVALLFTLACLILVASACSRDQKPVIREALSEAPELPSPVVGTPEGYRRPHFAATHRTAMSTEASAAEPAEAPPSDELTRDFSRLAAKLNEMASAPDWLDTAARVPAAVSDENAVSRIHGEGEGTNVCSSVEPAGLGKESALMPNQAWTRVQELFFDARQALLAWLSDHRSKLPPQTFEFMQARIRASKLQRAPAGDPDLAWRGIVIATTDALGDPVVKLGSGFFTLVFKDTKRARFELTRVLAHAWAPCELTARKLAQPWDAYLRCMGFHAEGLGCGAGEYSEAGWAVSSAIASTVASPGCELPAFNDSVHQDCPQSFLLPLVHKAESATHSTVLSRREVSR